jgi:hypothetical protein
VYSQLKLSEQFTYQAGVQLYQVERILQSFTITAQTCLETHFDHLDISFATLKKFLSVSMVDFVYFFENKQKIILIKFCCIMFKDMRSCDHREQFGLKLCKS